MVQRGSFSPVWKFDMLLTSTRTSKQQQQRHGRIQQHQVHVAFWPGTQSVLYYGSAEAFGIRVVTNCFGNWSDVLGVRAQRGHHSLMHSPKLWAIQAFPHKAEQFLECMIWQAAEGNTLARFSNSPLHLKRPSSDIQNRFISFGNHLDRLLS